VLIPKKRRHTTREFPGEHGAVQKTQIKMAGRSKIVRGVCENPGGRTRLLEIGGVSLPLNPQNPGESGTEKRAKVQLSGRQKMEMEMQMGWGLPNTEYWIRDMDFGSVVGDL